MSSDLVLEDAPAPTIVRLTLNRPARKNALSVALRDDVTAALNRIAADGTTKVVIITGADGTFSAGFDLGEFQTASNDPAFHEKLWQSSDAFHLALLKYPLPLIAAVDGPALAGGFDMATLCDLRIASSRASFGHPETTFADVIYTPLQDLIGGAAARDLVLTGRRIDAAEALRLGLVTEVVAPEALAARAVEVASQIARAPRAPLLRTKAKIIARTAITFKDTLSL